MPGGKSKNDLPSKIDIEEFTSEGQECISALYDIVDLNPPGGAPNIPLHLARYASALIAKANSRGG